MAVPATTARVTPTGIFLKDGYQSLIATDADPNISFWEKTVGLPGLDGGDAIDVTTQHNTTYRVFRSRALVTMTEFTVLAAYDPNVYNNILNILNVEASWTINMPDASTLDFFGFLRVADFSDHEEGTQPEVTITIQPTNYDPVNNVEQALVLTSVAGT